MDKAVERLHFDYFMTNVPDLAGATIDDTGESPDIIATLPNRKIGIELTEYYHGKAPKGAISQAGREAFERQVVRDAQRIFEAKGGPNLYVRVNWLGHIVTERRERVARAIAQAVTNRTPVVPATDVHIDIMITNAQLPTVLQPWVHSIGILRNARDTAHLWTVPQAGGIDANANVISDDIAGKEADILSYRPCNEYWLLIYAGAGSLASTMTADQLPIQQTYTTAFDRVYVLDSVDRVYPLKTSTPANK